MDADDELTRLALAAGRGDRSALSEFIRASQADVWRFVAHMAGPDRADDQPARDDQPDAHLDARQLLCRLDRDRREALLLTQVMGFSYAEAAEICGCPVGTVRSRVSRARVELVAGLDAARRELATV